MSNVKCDDFIYIYSKGKKVVLSSQCQNISTLVDWKLLEIIFANIDVQKQSKLPIDQPLAKHIRHNNVPISKSINLDNCHDNIDIFDLN